MIPNLDPKLMKAAMKRMGIKQEDVAATEVVIKGEGQNIVIKNPQVTKIMMGGQESFQITGDVEELSFSEEDIKTVAQQANVPEEDAKKALLETKGDLAEAIMKLTKA